MRLRLDIFRIRDSRESAANFTDMLITRLLAAGLPGLRAPMGRLDFASARL